MYDARYLNNNHYQIYDNFGFSNSQSMNNNSECRCVKSYFRILNAISGAPALDVYVNEMLIASNLKHGDFSRYMQFMPGNYIVSAVPSGGKEAAIFETNITIDRNLAYTGVLSGEMLDIPNLSIHMIPEHKEPYNMNNMAAVKIIHVGLDAPPIDLITDDGTILFSGVKYGETTENIALPSGRYILHLKETNSDKNILTIPTIDFAPKMYYTVFVIGKYGESPRIIMLVPEDGLNYLELC
ncbi:hypothetical protein J2Z76_002983 [Sedimentibacter acidaminivorans]|uniref:DUF4397 domain-containing protein n=1 Tax=Sedimentibacter acidaminivorans TaxID=913099 RepID=A0ABS4GHF3_9FIRM|nr:DUF4397 domain-containing protein [Sedimentibacter acidaminivorans]MBP1927110.1 hypothetical protein [Sedimentibacter acidaminivorans]